MKLKSLNYSMDIAGTTKANPSIFINPGNHNIEKNKKTGHRRFYMNEKGLKKFSEFVLEQWENNLKQKD
jgi:hypothetical protein